MKTFRAIGVTKNGYYKSYQDKAKDFLSFAMFLKQIYPDVDWQMIIEI